jgi:hypothetical protein
MVTLLESLLQSFSDLFHCFFLFVLIFPLLHFFVLTTDHRRHKLLVALVFFMAIRHVFTVVVALQQVAIYQQNSAMMMMGALILGGDAPRLQSIWMIERNRSFTFTQLLGSYTPSLFRQHTRLHQSTFHYLCSIVAPSLARKDTHLRESISLETRVAISLSRLSTGNTLQMCGEVYGISRSSASIIIKEFCVAIKKHLKPLVIRKQTESSLRAMAAEFEKLHGIPYIIGAVDGSHISIIAPPIDPTSYYCRKGFYSALLQGVVDKDYKFWDFDFVWAGQCHDWTLFQNTEIGKKVISGVFLLYKFIRDAAYPMRPWFYSPFKEENERMSRAKAHWNFIQSSTRMAAERTFGILKGQWRILLKRIEACSRFGDNLYMLA